MPLTSVMAMTPIFFLIFRCNIYPGLHICLFIHYRLICLFIHLFIHPLIIDISTHVRPLGRGQCHAAHWLNECMPITH